MMMKKRGLGKGLNELMSNSNRPLSIAEEIQVSKQSGELHKLPIEVLQRGQYQPRRDMRPEALEELADSIRAQGVIQPLIVRKVSDKKYEIIAGERRWRAAQIAELDEVPVIIRDVPDEAAIAMSLIENIQRENLNALEEANALQRLLEEFQMTHQEVAEAVGKSRTTVTNMLRLLALEAEVKTMLEHGDLEMGHAKVLLGLQGEAQKMAARYVVAKELSVRETENYIRRLLLEKSKVKNKAVMDPDVKQLLNELSEKLGAKVNIQYNVRGKGKLTIHFNSLDALDGILEHIK